MAQAIRVQAIGTRKILKKLDALPGKIRTKIVKKVISKGTTVLKKEIVKRAPVGTDDPRDEAGNPRKRLRKSFAKRTRIARGKTGVHGVVGVPPDYPKFVFMLVAGIKPHRITARNGKTLGFAGGAYRSVNHPGVAKMSFMSDALTATIPKARAIMATQLKTGLRSVAK